MPVPLAGLGRIDAVVISHDHYDHLDMDTIRALVGLTQAVFLVPLGVGAHLDAWGVPPSRVVECDWEEGHDVRGVRVTAVEAQHFSGRGLRRDGTLWASWVLAGRAGRVFFSGDSGFFDGYARLGADHGPFDLSLMAVGAYDPAWRDIHLDPEEAVEATLLLRGGLLVPIHWCTFVLAPHPWAEPVERLLVAAATRGVPVAVPRVGDRVDPSDPPGLDAVVGAAARRRRPSHPLTAPRCGQRRPGSARPWLLRRGTNGPTPHGCEHLVGRARGGRTRATRSHRRAPRRRPPHALPPPSATAAAPRRRRRSPVSGPGSRGGAPPRRRGAGRPPRW